MAECQKHPTMAPTFPVSTIISSKKLNQPAAVSGGNYLGWI